VESPFPDVESLMTKLSLARQIARENIEINQVRNASYHDLKRIDHQLKVGDSVVCRKIVRKPGVSPKLAKHYNYGPYTILEFPGPVTAVIETTSKGKLHRERVHVEKLKRYYPRDATPVEVELPYSEDILIEDPAPAPSSIPVAPTGTDEVRHEHATPNSLEGATFSSAIAATPPPSALIVPTDSPASTEVILGFPQDSEAISYHLTWVTPPHQLLPKHRMFMQRLLLLMLLFLTITIIHFSIFRSHRNVQLSRKMQTRHLLR